MIETRTGIQALLESYNAITLQEMAMAAGLAVTQGKKRPAKAVLLQGMALEFFTRERVLASYRRLERRERAVLGQLLLRGGRVNTVAFRSQLVRSKLVSEAKPAKEEPYRFYGPTYAASPRRPASTVFEDVVARLTLAGLVFSQDDEPASGGHSPKFQYDPGPVLFVPEVVRGYLPAPEVQPIDSVAEPSNVQASDPALLLTDLYLYWDYARRNPIPLTKTGLVSKRHLREINALLLAPDPQLEKANTEPGAGRLSLLRKLLLALGLLREAGGSLRPAGESAVAIPEFWAWPQGRQLAACSAVWPTVGACAELGSDAEYCNPQYERARKALLGALKEMPAGKWVEIGDLLDCVRIDDVDFLLLDHSRAEASRGWYHSSSDLLYGSREEVLRRIERWEERFAEGSLSGFLHPAGLVDLGYDGKRLSALRLTALGAALLSGGDTAAASAEGSESYGLGRVVVQPSFQILALGPVGLDVLARLDLCARRDKADRGAFAYQLTREWLYRASQMGLDAAAVIGLLEQVSAVELPQNVRRSLEEWGVLHERIVFRSGVSLVQAASPELLRELLEGAQTGPLLARAVTPQVALAAGEKKDALIAALLAEGCLPAVSGADPRSADQGVTIDEEGAIQAVHGVPSLHLRGRLARLAEELPGSEGRQWQLTPASLARAAQDKEQVLWLLEELGRLNRGPLPERLVERVKIWGGYYGSAAAQTLTLIEFRDATALEELRQQPQLRRLLSPFRAGNRALAVVPGERLAEVKEMLAGLGVRVKEGLA